MGGVENAPRAIVSCSRPPSVCLQHPLSPPPPGLSKVGSFIALALVASGPAQRDRTSCRLCKIKHSQVFLPTIDLARNPPVHRCALHCTGWLALTASARPPPGRPFVHCKHMPCCAGDAGGWERGPSGGSPMLVAAAGPLLHHPLLNCILSTAAPSIGLHRDFSLAALRCDMAGEGGDGGC